MCIITFQERVAEISDQNTSNKVIVPTVQADPAGGVAHNYSTSKLNSTEQAKELLRQQLAQVIKCVTYLTICHKPGVE